MSAEQIAKKLYSGAKPSGDGWMTRCPCPHDRDPSLSIKDGNNGNPVVNCFAGCDPGDIFAELKRRGLVAKKYKRKKVQPEGVSLRQIAEIKELPVKFLKSLGLKNIQYPISNNKEITAVEIPYFDFDGEEIATRYRISITGDRFRWKKGDKASLYGLD